MLDPQIRSPMPRSPEFLFDSAATSPYTTAPSSPRLFGEPFNYNYHYTSAPTSPTRAAAIYRHFSDVIDSAPPSPHGDDDVLDFAFDSGRLSVVQPLPNIASADELFERGRIRPLQLQPPADAAIHRGGGANGERGRERISPASASRSRAKDSRSVSPLRAHTYFTKNTAPVATSTAPPARSSEGSKKWSLKDLLLFRSASEGRVTGRESKDPLRMYALFSALSSSSTWTNKKKGGEEEERVVSFGVTEKGERTVKRGGRSEASPHERLYTENRTASAERRRKTPLPYQGLFSCTQFNPFINSITKGYPSS